MTRYSQTFWNYIKSLCVKMTRYLQCFLNYIKSFCDIMFKYSQIVYTLKELLSKTGSISFFLIFWHAKILGCHIISIKFSLNSFFKCFMFFKFNLPSQKSDMNNSFSVIHIIISIINFNIIMIYIKNTLFITRKYGTTTNFILNRVYIIIYDFTCNKLIRNEF